MAVLIDAAIDDIHYTAVYPTTIPKLKSIVLYHDGVIVRFRKRRSVASVSDW
jgi:hypothetical protein